MGLIKTGWGRLGRDIEIQYSQSGFAFGKTGIACKIPKKNQDGTYGDTEWVEVTFLGKAAETAANILQKGSKVWFTGYDQTEEWDDKQNPGQKRKQTRCIIQQWEALDPNPNAQGGQGNQQGFGGGQPQGFGGGQPQGGFNPNQPQNNPQQGFGGGQQGGFNPNQPQNRPQNNPQQGFGGGQHGFGQGNPQGNNQGGGFNPQGGDVPF